jgi:ribosome-associated protein
LKDKKLVDFICKTAESKKANNIIVFELKAQSRMADFMVLLSGESKPQIRAIVKSIEEDLRKKEIKGFCWEGEVSSGWIILDIGNIVIHIMDEILRKHYNLEEIWQEDATIYYY